MAAILFHPKWIRTIIPEKISGSELVWDLSKLAADNGYSVFLLGGFGDTTALAANKLCEKFPGLVIAGYSSKNPDDPAAAEAVKKASPDMLFVAYGPLRQEYWITANLKNLPVRLAIGLGGTFDYLAGKRPFAPKFMRNTGLEWLYRLLTQPFRFKRIFKATAGLAMALLKYKVFMDLPFRKNAASVIINSEGKVFIARFNQNHPAYKAFGKDSARAVARNGYWQLPQGGIEEGEELVAAVRREVFEETGMRSLEHIMTSEKIYSYLWRNSRPLISWHSTVKKRFRFKGQQQRIVYFKFTGPEEEIRLDQDEFVEYRWVDLDRLDEEVHEEKAAVAKIAKEDLKTVREAK